MLQELMSDGDAPPARQVAIPQEPGGARRRPQEEYQEGTAQEQARSAQRQAMSSMAASLQGARGRVRARGTEPCAARTWGMRPGFRPGYVVFVTDPPRLCPPALLFARERDRVVEHTYEYGSIDPCLPPHTRWVLFRGRVRCMQRVPHTSQLTDHPQHPRNRVLQGAQPTARTPPAPAPPPWARSVSPSLEVALGLSRSLVSRAHAQRGPTTERPPEGEAGVRLEPRCWSHCNRRPTRTPLRERLRRAEEARDCARGGGDALRGCRCRMRARDWAIPKRRRARRASADMMAELDLVVGEAQHHLFEATLPAGAPAGQPARWRPWSRVAVASVTSRPLARRSALEARRNGLARPAAGRRDGARAT